MASHPETEPRWERPQRRGGRRAVWVGAAAVIAAAIGGVIGGAGDDEDLSVDEVDDAAEARPQPPPVDDEERWTLHSDPDNAQVVAPASDGGAWVITRGAGVVRWHDATTHQRHPLDERVAGWTGMAAAGEGAVWMVAGRRGDEGEPSGTVLARFDGQEWTTHPLDERLTHAGVGALAVDDDGDVWVGLFQPAPGSGELAAPHKAPVVARFDGRTWTLYTRDDGLPVGDVRSLTTDDRGAVWVVTVGHRRDAGDGGVARFDGQGWTSWSLDEVPADEVRSVAAGGGSVWALARNEPRKPQEPPEPDDPPPPPSRSLLRFDGSGWTAAVTDDALPEGHLGNLAVDGAGVPWLVVHQRRDAPRLVRFDGDAWATHTTADGLPAAEVRAITGDDTGGLWAATPGGVARFDGDAWTAFTIGAEGPPGDALTAVAADDEAVWVAGGGPTAGRFGSVWPRTGAGVGRFDGEEWTTWTADDGLADDAVAALTIGENGAVWAGTAGGVSRFADGEWTSWTADDGLAHPRVPSVAVGADGTVWAVIRDGFPGPRAPRSLSPTGEPDPAEPEAGIARFDGERWTSWTGEDLPDGGLPTAVATGERGGVWVATTTPADREENDDRPEEGAQTGGVWRFVDGEWITDLRSDELPSRDVHAVAVGDDGTVWAGTDRGIARFNGVGWSDPVGDGPLGLSDAIGRTRVETVAAAPNHTAWFGGRFGLAWVDGRDWTIADRRDPARGRRPVGAVFAIAVTDETVWAGTDRGLARFDSP